MVDSFGKHRLVHPDEWLSPYDETLKSLGRSDRRRWTDEVLAELALRARLTGDEIVEIHAGSDYRDFGLIDGLRDLGCEVVIPAEGLSFGQQLRFYRQ